MRCGAARADPGREVLAHAVGDQELRILGPAVRPLGEPDLLLTERLAMRRGGVLPMRRAVADVAVQDDERGASLGLAEDVERMLDEIDVVRIAHPEDIPAVAQKPRGDVLGERDPGAALDRDVVVVVDPAKVVEAEMSGERSSLGAHALHQAAVAAHRVDVVVEDLEARLVVAAREPALGDRHADAGGDALPERTSRRFHPRHPVILGMTGRVAAELAEALDVVQRDGRLADRLVVGVHCLRAGQV